MHAGAKVFRVLFDIPAASRKIILHTTLSNAGSSSFFCPQKGGHIFCVVAPSELMEGPPIRGLLNDLSFRTR